MDGKCRHPGYFGLSLGHIGAKSEWLSPTRLRIWPYVKPDYGYFAEEGFDVNLISTDFEARKIGLNNGSIPIVNGDFQFFP